MYVRDYSHEFLLFYAVLINLSLLCQPLDQLISVNCYNSSNFLSFSKTTKLSQHLSHKFKLKLNNKKHLDGVNDTIYSDDRWVHCLVPSLKRGAIISFCCSDQWVGLMVPSGVVGAQVVWGRLPLVGVGLQVLK